MRKIIHYDKLKIFDFFKILIKTVTLLILFTMYFKMVHFTSWFDKIRQKFLFCNVLILRGCSIMRMLKTSPNSNEK